MNTPPKKTTPNTAIASHIQKPVLFKPTVAQLKTAVSARSVKSPVAPPAYRPQPTPKVLQTKSSASPSPHRGHTPGLPVVHPVYRLEAKKMVQPRALSQQRTLPAQAPERKRVAQTKMVATAPTGRLLALPGKETLRTVVQSKRSATSHSTMSPPGRPISHLNPRSPSNRTVQLVAVGDQTDRADGWMQIRDNTGDWAAGIHNGSVFRLIPIADFRARVPAAVNDVQPQFRHGGCVLCVLADFMETTVLRLIQHLGPSKMELVRSVYAGGLHRAGEIMQEVLQMGIVEEEFANYQLLRQTIEHSDPTPEWEGALGFGSHIVRASWHAGILRLWDPQLGVENPAIQLGVPVTLYTFSVSQ